MNIRSVLWGILVIAVMVGLWFYISRTSPELSSSGTAGINGSQNQGNLGGADSGDVRRPEADAAQASVIGDNLALGTDGSATLGTYLIGYNGKAVYTYAKDTTSTSTCYDMCAEKWPPYIVGSSDNLAHVKEGVKGGIGVTTRTDGNLQMTYNNHPLYFYAGDTGSGAKGQGLGGVWFVVKP